jgi:chlorite dismutase
MVEAPPTDEGWYVLHDFRSVDWDAWRETPTRHRDTAITEGTEYLQQHEAVADADEGTSAVFSVIGHKADLLIIHFRSTLEALSRAERQFEQTALAGYTTQPMSYISVTEVSGYTTSSYFDESESADPGVREYMNSKLTPEIPQMDYVCFYPMSKKRDAGQNWYSLPFEERATLMESHADTGKSYAGTIKQVISSSVGFESDEWGVTLFADDPTAIKDVVYEMRFDDVSAKYSEFGEFYMARRFPPIDLEALLAGVSIPTGAGSQSEQSAPARGNETTESASPTDHSEDTRGSDGEIREQLAEYDIYAGKPHGEDVYATVLYSDAQTESLFDEVKGLRSNFDHYDTHVKTAVYEARSRDRNAVVSIWDTQSAAETAAGFLSELPNVVSRAGEESGFGTMGMFYTVMPEHRGDFHDTFDSVGELLAQMNGHQETDLMINLEDENDMFISSQWDGREDAMSFFRSDEFSETVQWGREVLADRPRHVFLA